MSNATYTSIPDTSDIDYWELKTTNTKERSKTFVPRNRELHRELLQRQREASNKRKPVSLQINHRQSLGKS